jgi:putative membrane protein
MKRSLPTLGLATAIALIGLPAMAQTSVPRDRAATPQKLNKADQLFLSKAIQGDLAEVKIGSLAQEKGQSDEVKQFGKMLERSFGNARCDPASKRRRNLAPTLRPSQMPSLRRRMTS